MLIIESAGSPIRGSGWRWRHTCVALACAALLAATSSTRALAQPNIVLFLVDDMGWNDTSVEFHSARTVWNDLYNTPSMQRLADRGLKFTNAYAASPVCSPTRASIMTGKNPGRNRVSDWVGHGISGNAYVRSPTWAMTGLQPGDGNTTLPSVLRANGYRTAHVGKAHFGGAGTPGANPQNLGFDINVAGSHLGGGWVERIQGETSQLVISTQPYTAGILQRVTGLTPGVGYGFHAAMLTIFQTSAPPSSHGTMTKQVGMDPTGGLDPLAATVIWSAPDDHDEGPWDINQRTAVYAQGQAMTVFVRVISPHESGDLPFLNYSFLDSAILAQTPQVRATSPALSETPTFSVRWDNALPAPGSDKLKWYDVQWLDEAEGVWHDWQEQTKVVEAHVGLLPLDHAIGIISENQHNQIELQADCGFHLL